jgi:hypothetical protein
MRMAIIVFVLDVFAGGEGDSHAHTQAHVHTQTHRDTCAHTAKCHEHSSGKV